MWNGEFYADAFFSAIGFESVIDVLPSPISTQDLCVGVVMVGKESIEAGEPGSEIRLPSAGQEPEVACFVVNEQAEIMVLSKGWGVHRATDIRVQSSQVLSCDFMPSPEGTMCHLSFNASYTIKFLGIVSDIW